MFIGAFQPRAEMNESGTNRLCNKITTYVRGKNSEKSRTEILSEIDRLFVEFDNIIYSEEMILHTGDWRGNVARLFDLFGHLNVALAYCLRDARTAVPSYYCESFGGLDQAYRDDYQKFLEAEWAGIYDLSNVLGQFDSAGFKKVNCFRFEDFVSGKTSLNRIFDADIEDSSWQRALVPPMANKKSLPKNDKEHGSGQRYTVLIDHYRSLPYVVRRLLEMLRSAGLGGLTKAVRARMTEQRELVVKPNPLLDEMFRRNSAFIRDLNALETSR